jgi:hypothetical protein
MVLWMKASKLFTVDQNNTYPLGITAIGLSSLYHATFCGPRPTDMLSGIALTLLTSVAIDATKVHAPYGILACVIQIISCVILLCWNSVSTGARMAAFCKRKKPPHWKTVKYPADFDRLGGICILDPACRIYLGQQGAGQGWR